MSGMRREFMLALLAGAVGAGLVVLAVRQAWAHAVFTPPRPLPAQDIAVTGQQLVPLASALALAALASLRASAVRAAARASALSGPLGGSTTSGAPSGGAVHEIVVAGPGRVIMAGAPWRVAAIAGAVAIVLAGLATAWRGPRWPIMSARFERSSPARPRGTDSASMWESLSRDVDPTVDDSTRT